MAHTRIFAGAIAVATGVAGSVWLWSQPVVQTSPRIPPPIDTQPGEAGDADFQQRRRAWYESLHRAAPGIDWAAMDASYRQARVERQQAERNALLAAGHASDIEFRTVRTAAVAGSWAERGSSAQSGRVTGAHLDSTNNRLTALSHGGNIWRTPLPSIAWTSPNDSATFVPNNNFGFVERLTGGVSGERLIVAGDRPASIAYSDNGGATFTASTGANFANPWYAMGLTARDLGASEVYFIRVHYDFTAPADWKAHLFSSVDRGASFTSRGFVGPRNQTALFSPRYGTGANTVYLLSGTTLSTISTGTQALVTVSTVPLSPALASGDSVALSGGITSGGQAFLFAFYSRAATNTTDVYYSANGGASWVARNPAPQRMFGLNSAESSTRDPNRVFVGGVDMYRSADGAVTWVIVNPWQQYYTTPATRLHADVPNIDVFVDGSNNERMYISTDGGLYESTDYAVTVNNLSLSGLNVSQYYDVYTRRSSPNHIFVGAQDQGYQKALNPTAGVQPFSQIISGDYAHLSSGDGGNTLWSVYVTFAMIDIATGVNNQSGLRYYDYAANSLTGMLFLAPLAHVPGQPNQALLAGGRIGGGSANNIIQLNYNTGPGTITGVADAFNFVDPVTAIAVSPHAGNTRYVMVTPSSPATPLARFYRRPNAGSWTQTATALPNGQFFYGNDIVADPAVPGRVYLAGSGYSTGNSVYVSDDDGVSFTSMSNGLPSTLVFNLAISSDGQHLFAAAETGAFYYDRALSQWVDIVALGAPNQIYWDVDFVDSQNTARFATYGRGIWDFVLASSGTIFANSFEP